MFGVVCPHALLMQHAVCAQWQPCSALVVATGHAYDSPAMPSCLLCRASRQVVQAGSNMQAFLDSLAMFKVGKLPLLPLWCGAAHADERMPGQPRISGLAEHPTSMQARGSMQLDGMRHRLGDFNVCLARAVQVCLLLLSSSEGQPHHVGCACESL